jgi:hypothetical protein
MSLISLITLMFSEREGGGGERERKGKMGRERGEREGWERQRKRECDVIKSLR